MVAGVLVKRQRCSQHTATTVRHPDHIQIPLQDSVLARGSVDRDVREIKRVLRAVARIRKIILIDGLTRLGAPVGALEDDDRTVISLLIQKGPNTRRRTQRHLVLATVSSGDDGYIAFHFYTYFRISPQSYKKKMIYARKIIFLYDLPEIICTYQNFFVILSPKLYLGE